MVAEFSLEGGSENRLGGVVMRPHAYTTIIDIEEITQFDKAKKGNELKVFSG